MRLDGMDLLAAVASKFGVANGIALATRQVRAHSAQADLAEPNQAAVV
jgi:hypothetical protein